MAKPCWKCGAPPSRPRLPLAPPSVDLTYLLTSNEVPTSSAIPTILHVISDSQARLDLLKAQIQSMEITLTQLLEQRDEMADRLCQHKAIMSPVRRVPAELMCEIFSLTLPWSRRVNQMVVHQPPSRLGHVCRSWRDTSLAYPSLWRFLDIYHSPELLVTLSYPLSMLETTLLRSANLPLEVTITWWEEAQGSIIDSRWLDLFFLHCPRWRSLRFPYYSAASLLDVLCRVREQLIQLRKVELPEFWADIHRPPPRPVPDFLSAAPALREVLLGRVDCMAFAPSLPVPWGQITHYRGVYSRVRQFEILNTASRLVECALGFRGDGELSADQVVTLPHLRRLYSNESDFLDHLQLPSLDTLSVSRDADTLPYLIHRSSCHLTKLVLTSCYISTTFITVLRSVPTLRNLVVETDNENTDLFRALRGSHPPSSLDICPNLTSFAFGRIGELSGESALFSMLKSRLKPRYPSRLSFIRLFAPAPPPTTLVTRIQKFADGGLNIAFIKGAAGALLEMGCI